MRIELNVDTSHGEKRPVVEYIPENDDDVAKLQLMWQQGEIGMGRDDEARGYAHVKIRPGKWLWLAAPMTYDAVLAAHAALVSMLRDLRPDAAEVAPAIYALPSYLSEIIGQSGVTELAEQARVLAGDDALVGALPEDARFLLAAVSVLDIPELMTKLDKTAPGQGMEEEKP